MPVRPFETLRISPMIAVAAKFGIYAIWQKFNPVMSRPAGGAASHFFFCSSNRRDFLRSTSRTMETFVGYRVLV